MTVGGPVIVLEVEHAGRTVCFAEHWLPVEDRPAGTGCPTDPATVGVVTTVYVCQGCGGWQVDGWTIENLLEDALAQHMLGCTGGRAVPLPA